ncbi:MAG: hypothetical protein WD844_10665 [Thermoleophilaceae bacterium]
MRARLSTAAAPAAVFLLGAVLLGRQSLRVHTFQPDEFIYVTQARELVKRFPDALFDERLFYLGFERVHQLLQAAAISLFPPVDALRAGKLIPAVAFASAAIPAWLLARGLGLGRVASAAAAAAAVAVPWVALSTSFLNEPVAYPAVVWAVWGIWRCAVRGGPVNDLLAIGLVALAALSRSSLVVIAGALPLTILAHELRFAGGASVRARLVEVAKGLWRRHTILLVAFTFAATWVLFLGGVDSARGYYSASLLPQMLQVRLKAELLGVMLAQGLLIVTFVFALTWIARTLVKGDDPRSHAFVVAALATALLVAYSAAAVSSTQEERYLFYAGPLVVLCAVAGVARRELPLPLVGLFTAAAGVLVLTSQTFVEVGPYDHFSSPGRSFWRRVVLGNINTRAPGPLDEHAEAVALVVLAAVAVGVALALRPGQRAARWVVPATLGGIVAFGLVTAGYNSHRFVTGAGEPNGGGFDERAFIDKTLGREASYRYLDGNASPTRPLIWQEVAFFNASFQYSYVGYGGIRAAVSRRTGILRNPNPLATEIVALRQYRPVGLAARRIGGTDYLSERLGIFALAQPFRARWLELSGVNVEGGVVPTQDARFRVFGGELDPGRRHCLVLRLSTIAGTRITATTGSTRVTAVRDPGTIGITPVPLDDIVDRGYRDVRVGTSSDLRIHVMAVRPCPEAG